MSSDLLNERGYFWLSEVDIPEKQFAPNDVIFGTITIRNNGETKIELDGLLTTNRKFDLRNSHNTASYNVAGRLKRDGRSVLLINAYQVDYTIKSNNIDHENFVGNHCLVGDCSAKHLKDIACNAKHLSMPFGSFQDWLCINPINIYRDEKSVRVDYKKSTDEEFELEDRTVSLKHRMHAPWAGKSTDNQVAVKQQSFLEYSFHQPVNIEALVINHRKFNDLLLLLSNQEIRAEWPIVFCDNNDRSAKIYYVNYLKDSENFQLHKTWLTYPRIKELFPSILLKWNEIHRKIGPGFYLYLATRREVHQYSENRFMSLVGGLEALHRTIKQSNESQSTAAKIKLVCEIVDHSEQSNNKLKRWIRSKLKHAAEPSLEQRLFDLISEIPIKFERDSLRNFTKTCADARNNIAHFGQFIRAKSIEDIYQKMSDLSVALDYLYHARILMEIGVSENLISEIFQENFVSSLIKRSLEAADLKIEDTLSPS